MHSQVSLHVASFCTSFKCLDNEPRELRTCFGNRGRSRNFWSIGGVPGFFPKFFGIRRHYWVITKRHWRSVLRPPPEIFEISGSEKCILVEPGDGIIQRTGNDMHFNSQVLWIISVTATVHAKLFAWLAILNNTSNKCFSLSTTLVLYLVMLLSSGHNAFDEP